MFPRSTMLAEHLRHTVPAIVEPTEFVPVAQKAIERASRGDWDSRLELPGGLGLTVEKVVAGLHLEGFVDREEEE